MAVAALLLLRIILAFTTEARRGRGNSPLDRIYAYAKLRDKPRVTIRLDEFLRNDSNTGNATSSRKKEQGSSSFSSRIGTHGQGTGATRSLYIYEHRIPRIIHQMWKTVNVQVVFSEYIQSWIRLHPFWEYRFWTDASGEEFIKNVYPWFWPTFEKYNGIQRSDALRYFILHHYGGVYADLDVEPVLPLDPILNQTLILSQEPLAHAVVLENRVRQVCNAFMASPPQHPFWPFVHRYMKEHQVRNDPVGSTGPRMLDAALNSYRAQEVNITNSGNIWEDVHVGAPEVFMPLFDDKLNDFKRKCRSWGLSDRQKEYCKVMKARKYVNRIENNTLTVHHWSHTWLGHVTTEDFVDVWRLVNRTISRYLANTYHGVLIDDQKLRRTGDVQKLKNNSVLHAEYKGT